MWFQEKTKVPGENLRCLVESNWKHSSPSRLHILSWKKDADPKYLQEFLMSFFQVGIERIQMRAFTTELKRRSKNYKTKITKTSPCFIHSALPFYSRLRLAEVLIWNQDCVARKTQKKTLAFSIASLDDSPKLRRHDAKKLRHIIAPHTCSTVSPFSTVTSTISKASGATMAGFM